MDFAICTDNTIVTYTVWTRRILPQFVSQGRLDVCNDKEIRNVFVYVRFYLMTCFYNFIFFYTEEDQVRSKRLCI